MMDVSFLKSAFNEGHYPSPDRPEVAFAGRSNVGKSSLINVLVNRKKMAKTSSTPGRTQAINYFEIHNKGMYLVDLPGYGFARVPLKVKASWGIMVENYLKSRENLKAVVVILDIRRDVTDRDFDLLNWLLKYGIHPIIVITKADKLSRQKAAERTKLLGRELKGLSLERAILFSAKTRQGKDEIWERIDRVIVGD